MTTTGAGIVLRHIRGLAAAGTASESADRQLLERFAVHREEAAFEAIVRRHGPMVLGVSRRILGNRDDAEDAFQATFLVLSYKAGAIARRESLGGWLYQVAYHMALKAKASAAARHRREQLAGEPGASAPGGQAPDPLMELTARELLAVLDEELHAMPTRFRTPLVLCYLEGKSRDEAARQLGTTLATLKRRLEQARERLRARLERRGVALPAALAAVCLTTAAVPHALAAATTQAAVSAASGHAAGLSSPAARLAAGSLRSITAGKWKVLGIAVLFVSLLGSGWLGRSTPADEQKTANPTPKRDDPQLVPDETKPMTVAGRVLGPDGKAAAGASVAVVARQGVLLSSWHGWTSLQNEILGQGKTDAQGRFRLAIRGTDPLMNVRIVRIVAMNGGAGLAWKALDPDAKEASVELRLTPVQPVRGRIVGIQGEPAAGLKIHVARITRKPAQDEREDDATIRPPASLPLAATTDKKGEFVFESFGPAMKLELEIKDPRYQRKDEWFVETADKKACENLSLVLPPGQIVEGRVIYADTRKPVPHARLMVVSPYIVDDATDAEGRFRISLFSGQFSKGDVGVHAYPPEGEPYMPGSGGLRFDKGVVHRDIEIALPRGRLLCGKITEVENGKPVAGAIVEYNGDTNVRARSGPDGRYQLAVWPATAGRLMVTHPGGDYIQRIIGSAGGSLDKPVGDPSYYHAIVEVDIKADDMPKEVNVTLRRGVTIAGSLIGPDDKPVASALMFVSAHKPRSEKTMQPVHVRDGRFEVRGCNPEQEYQLLFLEYPRAPRPLMMAESLQTFGQLWMAELVNDKDKRGASVKVLAKKAAAKPLTVRVAPCVSAKLRFTDAAAKAKAGFIPWLQLVVTPGPPVWKAIEDKTLAAEVVTLSGAYGDQPPGQPKTDAEGCVTYTGLIPGATYRIKTYGDNMTRNIVLKDFTVEAGKTGELEIVVK
jgi:RNA polymerase sigma factor (sigma-70 family)